MAEEEKEKKICSRIVSLKVLVGFISGAYKRSLGGFVWKSLNKKCKTKFESGAKIEKNLNR